MFSHKNSTFAVYLSGSIVKGHVKDKNESFWDVEEKEALKKGVSPHQLIQLDPAQRTDDLNDGVSILGRDMLQVIISDVVLVDARDKRGIGVGAEIDRAETQNIPIVAIVPENTTYHKFNTTILDQEIAVWKHPFIFGYATHVATSFENAGKYINEKLKPRSTFNVNPLSDRILGAIKHYINNQLEKDAPMYEVYSKHPIIKQRIDYISSMPFSEKYQSSKDNDDYKEINTDKVHNNVPTHTI